MFNLSVEEVPEYLADGVLVHNCWLYACANINPALYQENKDELREWGGRTAGNERQRKMAEQRRIRAGMSMEDD